MQKRLLLMNALSGNSDNVHYNVEAGQRLIAQRLDVSLEKGQQVWVDIDMSQVREIAPMGQIRPLPTITETLRLLIDKMAEEWNLLPRELYPVVIVPALGHVDALHNVTIETARQTDQTLTPVIM